MSRRAAVLKKKVERGGISAASATLNERGGVQVGLDQKKEDDMRWAGEWWRPGKSE